MSPQGNAHALVYQVLDQVLADKVVVSSTPRAIFAAIDTMRSSCAAAQEVRHVENIGVQIHRLQCALQHSDSTDVEDALLHLKSLAAQWLGMCIHAHH